MDVDIVISGHTHMSVFHVVSRVLFKPTLAIYVYLPDFKHKNTKVASS